MKETEPVYKKLENWWLKLANGGLLIIKRDGSSELWTSSKKTPEAQAEESSAFWKTLKDNKEVEAVLWSGMSTDNLILFVQYLIKEEPGIVEKIMTYDKPGEFLVKNYKKYFEKYELETDKDYTLRSIKV